MLVNPTPPTFSAPTTFNGMMPPVPPMPPAPPERRRHLGRKLAALVAGAVIVGSIGAAAGHGSSDAHANSSTSLTVSASAPESSPPESSQNLQVASNWRTDAVAAANGMAATLTDIGQAADDASTTGDTSSLTAACASGLGDVPGWRSAAAEIPDETIASTFTRVVDDVESAMQSCVNGDYSASATYLQQATVDAQAAKSAVDDAA
jgi:hypothetical protein